MSCGRLFLNARHHTTLHSPLMFIFLPLHAALELTRLLRLLILPFLFFTSSLLLCYIPYHRLARAASLTHLLIQHVFYMW